MSVPTRVYAMWSIYVRTSNMRKLRATHLPPIEAALEDVSFGWQIGQEEGDDAAYYRLVTYQNFEIEKSQDVIIPVLRRAYRLADGWRISGLGDLATGSLRHVTGGWNATKPAHDPPALESMMFEIAPGLILPPDGNGACEVVDRAGFEPA